MAPQKLRAGFVADKPDTWNKDDREGLGTVRAILAKRDGFVREITGNRWEAIAPGDWTRFDSHAFGKIVFEHLLRNAEIVPAEDKPRRWRAQQS